MADVFISYAHEDQAFVRRMVPALEAEGFSVWWDHTIPPGKTWNTYIARGIEEAKACIVVWSQHSVVSKWVMEEATLANDAEKLLPASIDDAVPPMGFRGMQSAQLRGWNGDRANAQWQLLVREVRELANVPAAPHAQRQHPRPRARPSHFAMPLLLVALALVAVFSLGALLLREAPSEQTEITEEAQSDVPATGAGTVEPAAESPHATTAPVQQIQPPRDPQAILAGAWNYSYRSISGDSGGGVTILNVDGSMTSLDGPGNWTLDGHNFSMRQGGLVFQGIASRNRIAGTWERPGFSSGTFELTRE